jgi:hypothetical protein
MDFTICIAEHHVEVRVLDKRCCDGVGSTETPTRPAFQGCEIGKSEVFGEFVQCPYHNVLHSVSLVHHDQKLGHGNETHAIISPAIQRIHEGVFRLVRLQWTNDIETCHCVVLPIVALTGNGAVVDEPAAAAEPQFPFILFAGGATFYAHDRFFYMLSRRLADAGRFIQAEGICARVATNDLYGVGDIVSIERYTDGVHCACIG